MNRVERKRLYKQAVSKWGYSLQLCMLMEESAELIQAVSKVVRRGEKDNSVYDNLAEEMADVEVMIEQIKITTDWMLLEDKVRFWKEKKLLRLKEIISKDRQLLE